ncbi:MAG TPA: hypothetical protein VLW26_13145 [Steroidobacteraceae bacterium]|nr:hypothetical protein [Steroidobacteraceae bacterium]
MLIDKPGGKRTTERKSTARRNWHAVTIVSTSHACAAAHALADKRFLSSEAPKLPLRDCDAARCECRYRHHEDRRAGARRQNEINGSGGRRIVAERRGGRGRRDSD